MTESPDRLKPPAAVAPVIPTRWQRPVFLATSAAVVLAVVVAAQAVMLPFVLALVIAYVLTPLVARVETVRPRRPAGVKGRVSGAGLAGDDVLVGGRKRVSRGGAIVIVYVTVLGSLSAFGSIVAPRVGHELGELRREVPSMIASVQATWVPAIEDRLKAIGMAPPPPTPAEAPAPPPAILARPLADGSFAIEVGNGFAVVPARGGYAVEPIRVRRDEPFDLSLAVTEALGKSVAYVEHNALELVRIGRDIVLGVGGAIFVFGITLMLAAYMMLTREKVLGFFRSLVRPSRRADWDSLIVRIDHGLSGVVRGQLIICLINGALSAVGFAIVGLKYWPLLALVSTVFSLIPIFGSIASAVPAVALGLTQSLGTATFVLFWIIGIHQLEANFLNPKIMGDSAKIHPVLVIFSLLVGEHFFHATGALLAVPTMSIAQSLFLHYRGVVHRSDAEFAGDGAGSVPPPDSTSVARPRASLPQAE